MYIVCTSLRQSYEPQYYYMEVVLLVYKLIMSAAVVLFLPDTLAQVRISLLRVYYVVYHLALGPPAHPSCSGPAP